MSNPLDGIETPAQLIEYAREIVNDPYTSDFDKILKYFPIFSNATRELKPWLVGRDPEVRAWLGHVCGGEYESGA